MSWLWAITTEKTVGVEKKTDENWEENDCVPWVGTVC